MPPVAAIVIGLGIAAAAGPVGVGVFGSMMLFQTMVFSGLSMVLGGIGKALKGTPKSNYSRTSTVRQAVYDGRVIYGQARVGGVLTYLETSGSKNEYLHLVYTLCAHELASIGDMYFEQEYVPLDSSGNAIGNYAGLVHVEKNLGTYEQQAFAGLIGSSSLWTVNHRQRNRACVYVRLKWNQVKFPSGIPNIAFEVTGRPVRGPRGYAIAYSNNSALCLADYLMDTEFGLAAQRKITVSASQLTQSGLNVFDLAHTADDNYAAAAFSIINSAPGSWLTADFGGAPREISEIRLYTDGAADGVMRLVYSDDNANWTNAVTNLRPILGRLGVPNKYRVPLCGLHRYWRLLVDVTATQGSITEVELLEPAVDVAGLMTAATTCDELVNLRAGGTEKRYTTDGAFDLTENPVDVVTALAGAMGGFCTCVGGQFALYPGKWRAPDASLSFNEKDLAGSMKIITRRSKRDVYNSVRGTFISPPDNWQPTNFPVVSDLIRLEEDRGERLYLDAQLPFTISSARAQRIARIALNRSRRQISVQARFKLTAYRFQPCDVIKLTNARFGWTDKLFEVETMQFATESSEGEEGPALVIDATLRETDSAVYDWTQASDELPQTGVLPAAFPTHGPCAAPTNLVLSPIEIVRWTDGIRSNIIVASWSMPDDQYVQSGGHIVVLYKKHVDVPWTVLATVDGDQTTAVVPNLLDATSYDVMIYATNLYGVKSSGISGTVTTTSTTTPIDGLADGTYGKTLVGKLNAGRPVIDFSEAIHLNKTFDYVADGASRFAAAELGADRTAGKSIDVLADGATYARPTYAQTYGGTRAYGALDSGNVLIAGGADFSRAYTNKGGLATQSNLDGVPDGSSYYRTEWWQRDGGGRGYNAIDGSNIVVAGGIDFGRAYTGKGTLATVNNMDGVPDGSTYYRTQWWQRDGGGRGYYGLDTSNMVVAGGIDFSRAYTNKNTDYIAEGGNKYAGEHGADVTGSHTANDTNYVYGSWSGYVGAGGVRGYNAIDTSNIVLAGSIDMARGYANKNLDNISDGTRVAWGSGSQRDNAVDGSGNLRLKNIGVVQATIANPQYTGSAYAVISEMTMTKNFGGNKVLLIFTATLHAVLAGSNGIGYVSFFRNGVQISPDVSFVIPSAANAMQQLVTMCFVDSGTPGNCTYDVRWRGYSGATMVESTSFSRTFQLVELG